MEAQKDPKTCVGRWQIASLLFSYKPKVCRRRDKEFSDIYTNRLYYHFVEKYVSHFKECGRQCKFVVPSKAEIDIFRLDKDNVPSKKVMD